MTLEMPDSFGLKGSLQRIEDGGATLSDEELAKELRRLNPKAKAELAKRVEARRSSERRVWFCGDRHCSGLPHGVYTYPHARGSEREDGRGSQYPPLGIDWVVWLILAGRGAGKSKTGSEYTRHAAKKISHLGLIGPTSSTLRNVMVEGPSGLIKSCEGAGESFLYEPSKQRFTFQNGAIATLYTAEEPERIRGSNLGFTWCDEPAFWSQAQTVWDMMMFALRDGPRPHVLATTTPLPSDFIKELVARESTRVVTGSTYDNRANLPEVFFQQILDKYEGTYLGRQEIYGEIIDDREGSLWRSEQFRYADIDTRQMERVVIGIDPAGSQGKRADITGIIVGGMQSGAIYAIDDLSGKFSPSGWARAAINAYEKYKADAIVVERNYGGDMCRATLKAEGFDGRIIEAKATDGKRLRAEPIAALYEQNESDVGVRAYHAKGGRMAKLEAQMVSWIPGEGKSPDRLDAWVWAATALTKRAGRASMGNPTGHIGPVQYRGPGSPAARKDAKGSRWLRR